MGVVAAFGDEPHRVAGHRIVHGRRPHAESVKVLLVNVKLRRGDPVDQIAAVDGNDLGVKRVSGDRKHVEREDERIMVVAKVAGVVGIVVGAEAP